MVTVRSNKLNPWQQPLALSASQNLRLLHLPGFIKGNINKEPPPFRTKVVNDKIRICKVEGRFVELPVPHLNSKAERIARITRDKGKTIAKLYSRTNWSENQRTKQETHQPKEEFFISKDGRVENLRTPAETAKQSPPAISPPPRVRKKRVNTNKIGPAIKAWSMGKSKENPAPPEKPIEKTTMPNGTVHLCNLPRKAVLLRLGPRQEYGEKAVTITLERKGSSYFAIVKVDETGERFKFRYKASLQEVNYHPKAKLLESSAA